MSGTGVIEGGWEFVVAAYAVYGYTLGVLTPVTASVMGLETPVHGAFGGCSLAPFGALATSMCVKFAICPLSRSA